MISVLKQKYKALSVLDRFIVKGAFFLLCYLILRYMLLNAESVRPVYAIFRDFLISTQVFLSSGILSLLGFDIEVAGYVVRIPETGGIRVIMECVGLGLMAWYSALILIYPGDKRSKFFYIPFGILAIFLINTLRIATLVLVSWALPGKVRFFDSFVFRLLLYLFVFVMWFLWIRKYGLASAREQEA